MKKNIWIFGLLSGITVAAFMVTSTLLCRNNPDFEGSMSMLLGYTGMLVAFSFIFVGIKNLRDKHLGGSISLGKAFMTGLAIALIGSTIYVLVWLVEYYAFFPDFMERYADHMIKKAQESGASQAEIAKTAKEMAGYREMYKNPLFVILFTYFEILPVGLVVSLICALILKRKPKAPQPAL